MQRFFTDLKNYIHYIGYAAKASLKSELDGSRIGWIWWILDPVMFMLIYMFVFTVVFQRTTDYLVAFIFLGINIWKYFNGTVQSCVPLIKQSRNIISKVYLPKFALVLTRMTTNAVKLAFSFVVVVGLMIWYRIMPTLYLLQLIPVLGVLGLLTFGLSLLVMHVGVYFEDLAKFLRPAFQLLFYASGVFYPMQDALGGQAAELLMWINPAALLIAEVRNAVIYGRLCNWGALCLWALLGAGLTALSLGLIYRSENEYVKLV